MSENWVSVNAAADHFGVKPATIQAWCRNGTLSEGKSCMKAGRVWRVKISEAETELQSESV